MEFVAGNSSGNLNCAKLPYNTLENLELDLDDDHYKNPSSNRVIAVLHVDRKVSESIENCSTGISRL